MKTAIIVGLVILTVYLALGFYCAWVFTGWGKKVKFTDRLWFVLRWPMLFL